MKSPIGRFIEGQIGRFLILRSEVNLTLEQKKKLVKVLHKHAVEWLGAFGNAWGKRDALRAAVLADNPDEAAIRKAAAEFGTALGDVGVATSKTVQEVRPILTEQQRKSLRRFCDDTDAAVVCLVKELQAKAQKMQERHSTPKVHSEKKEKEAVKATAKEKGETEE